MCFMVRVGYENLRACTKRTEVLSLMLFISVVTALSGVELLGQSCSVCPRADSPLALSGLILSCN